MAETPEIAPIDWCLQQLAMHKVKPTEALSLLIERSGWMTNERARNLIARSPMVDVSWDAYLIDDTHESDLRGIYLFGPDRRAYRAFELE